MSRRGIASAPRRETVLSRRGRSGRIHEAKKGGRPDWVRIPVAGIERLMEAAAEAL